MLLSEKQIQSLKNVVQDELTKRGFHVKIDLKEEEKKSGEYGVTLTSEDFQTTPVLFKKLNIQDFGSSVREIPHKEEYGGDKEDLIIKVWISVNIRLKTFDGGWNFTSLFNFQGVCFGEDDRIYSVKIG
jgi:hypothetical protein